MPRVATAFRMRARGPKAKWVQGLCVRLAEEGSVNEPTKASGSQPLPKGISVASDIRELESGVGWNPFGQGVAEHAPCTLNACRSGTYVEPPIDRGWTRIGRSFGHPTDSLLAPSKQDYATEVFLRKKADSCNLEAC